MIENIGYCRLFLTKSPLNSHMFVKQTYQGIQNSVKSVPIVAKKVYVRWMSDGNR